MKLAAVLLPASVAAFVPVASVAQPTAATKAGVQPGGPVAVPRATFIATMDGEFRKMDANHDGVLTRKEVELYEQAMLGVAIDNRRRALFAALDADHNGVLTPQEFARLELPAPAIDPAPLFAQNDLNHDGQVTLVEYRTAKLANFDRMDTDKDGIVTPAEMKAAGLIK